MNLADILIWPTVGASDFIWLIVFVLFMGFTYFIINLFFRKQKSLNESKGFAYAEIIGRGFSPDESKILKKFIDQLSDEKKETLSATRNWKFLRKDIYQYLLDSSTDPNLSVRIFDRLFLNYRLDHSFHVGDIIPGELAALITEHGEELTRVVKATPEDLLLSSPKSLIPPMTRNLTAKVYIFRPREGGFYISGIVIGAMNDAILFHIEGKPQHAGHAHLMIQERFPVEVLNWPRISEETFLEDEEKRRLETILENEDSKVKEDLNSLEYEIRKRFGKPGFEQKKNSQEQAGKLDMPKAEPEKAKNINFFCIATKLSDRGLLFELPEDINPDFWKRSELWELKFKVPKGRNVETKAKIFPSSGSKTHFIARFIDMDESLRIAIYEDIKAQGGNREVLN